MTKICWKRWALKKKFVLQLSADCGQVNPYQFFTHLLEAYTVEPLYTDTKTKKVLKGRFWSRADYWDNMKETILGKAVLRERDGPYKGGLWSRFQLYT